LFIAPLMMLMSLFMAWREIDTTRFLFWVTSATGLLLLLAQLRLHYFGSFAIFMPLLVVADGYLRRGAFKPAVGWSVLAVAFAVAFSPAVRTRFFGRQILAGDGSYMMIHRLFPQLGNLCRDRPGVMLVNAFDGHYIRFHTDCKVIANNFLVTEQDVKKFAEVDALMHAPAAKVLEMHPSIAYVFVHRNAMFISDPEGYLELAPPDYPGVITQPLVRELLDSDPKQLPPRFRLEINIPYSNNPGTNFARVFAILPSTATP
ncbi:MAG: hypothetical protein ABI769_11885, partial [Pseudomonadota bacterium]